MKFIIVLLLVSLALSSSGHKQGKGEGKKETKRDRNCKSSITDKVEKLGKLLEKNETRLATFISILEEANLTRFVVISNDSRSVDFDDLAQSYFTVLPILAPSLSQFNIPKKIQENIDNFIDSINDIQTNRTVLNGFIGMLFLANETEYFTGSVSELLVDFEALQKDPEASQTLACFLLKENRRDNGKKSDGKGKKKHGKKNK